MEKLVKAIELANKYKDVDFEIDRDIVRFRVKGVQDVVEIREVDGKLKVLVLPSHHKEEVDLARVEDIIQILQKQANYKSKTYEEVQQIKQKYTKGTRIKINKIYELRAPAAGTIGTVESVDDAGTIQLSNIGINIVLGVDDIEILSEEDYNGTDK